MKKTNLDLTPLGHLIKKWEEENGLHFIPSKKFYKHVGINQKRLPMLIEGKAELLIHEAKVLAKYFKAPIESLLK